MPAMSLAVYVPGIAAPLSLPPPVSPAHPAHSYPPLLSLKSLSSKAHLISLQHIQRASVPLNSQLPILLHYHLTSSWLHLTLSSSTFPTHGEGISLQTPRWVYLMLMWHKDGHNGRRLDAPRPGHGAVHTQYKHTVRTSFSSGVSLCCPQQFAPQEFLDLGVCIYM